MVKNENSDTSPEQFFLQVIFSIWTIHIFSLEMNENDEWHRINKSWNICEARHGNFFEELKKAQVHDYENFQKIKTTRDSFC